MPVTLWAEALKLPMDSLTCLLLILPTFVQSVSDVFMHGIPVSLI